MDLELDRYKQLDLRRYAASVGYAIDRKESSRASTVMRSDHDKIIVSLKPDDGHYTYFSVRDDEDRGTIIDFIQRRTGGNLGAVRKELRAWAGLPAEPTVLPVLAKTVKDLDSVRRRYAAMQVPDRHPYLEDERGIPARTLTDWRFLGRIKVDSYGAAVFPHFDADDQLCGYELKNTGGFTGFAAGGMKGIWLSNAREDDRRLVIAESGIDALSYAVLFEDPGARYASIGGKLSPTQPDLIRTAIQRMQKGSEIVAAMDADEAGRGLAQLVRKAFDHAGEGMSFRQVEPEGEKDWNDVLRAQSRNANAPVTTRIYGSPTRADLS